MTRIQHNDLLRVGAVARLSRQHYGDVGGVARLSHAPIVARGWAQKLAA
jgi:hypothetical protein